MRSPRAPAPRGLAECGTEAVPGMGTGAAAGSPGTGTFPVVRLRLLPLWLDKAVCTSEGSGPRLSSAASGVLCLRCVPPSGRQPQGKAHASPPRKRHSHGGAPDGGRSWAAAFEGPSQLFWPRESVHIAGDQ